jgi:hypothetical protein
MSWFANIRNAALVACLASILGSLIPVWNVTQILLATRSANAQQWAATLLSVAFAYLFAAILPVFLFTLYRSSGTLHVSESIRSISIAAAIALGMTVAADTFDWIRFAWPYLTAGSRLGGVLSESQAPTAMGQISLLLNLFSSLAFIPLLVAFYRQPSDQAEAEVPVSKSLRVVTTVTVIAWGLLVVFSLVRLVLTPYTYVQLRDVALHYGRTPPALIGLMTTAFRIVVSQACLFAAPFFVYRCLRRQGPAVDGLTE